MTGSGRKRLFRQWTGAEVRLLRQALGLSVRDFASHIGVGRSVVTYLEAGRKAVIPEPAEQHLLDICVQRLSASELGAFQELLARLPEPPRAPDPQAINDRWMAVVQRALERQDVRDALGRRDIGTLFRILGQLGLTQRHIAEMTGQSQSEVWQIAAGRQVKSYDLLVRIAERLGIPRGLMGLDYTE